MEIEGEYFYGMRYGIWKFHNPKVDISEEIEYRDGFPWQGTYTNWKSEPILSPCENKLMLLGLKYQEGKENIIYRNNDNSIIICDEN